MLKLILLTLSVTAKSPLYDLLTKKTSNETYESVEFTGYAKFDPRDYQKEAKKSTGNYTTE